MVHGSRAFSWANTGPAIIYKLHEHHLSVKHVTKQYIAIMEKEEETC